MKHHHQKQTQKSNPKSFHLDLAHDLQSSLTQISQIIQKYFQISQTTYIPLLSTVTNTHYTPYHAALNGKYVVENTKNKIDQN